MRILLTNDDGVLAPGLMAMYRELEQLGSVHVVAPDSAQSAVAHAITLHAPLMVRRIHVRNEFEAWSVDGRPADCVKLALRELLDEPPDLVVAGINDGANVGINVLYSGTVAAAAEGAFFGIPSVAVSLEHGQELDFREAAAIACRLIRQMVASGLGAGQLINLNIPALGPQRPRGVKIVPQSTQVMEDRYERQSRSGGQECFWLRGDFGDPTSQSDTDLHAIRDGYVAITPLHFDMTHTEQLARMRAWPLHLPPATQ